MTPESGTDDAAAVVTVVVLGMHRSGTSMMGGLLAALGVDMGDDFKPSINANPTGFFEDKRFMKLNRRILRAAGGGHLAPPAPEAILAQKAAFRQEIRGLVEGKVSSRWGWKDPRTSLTIDLYMEHLPHPRVIVIRRAPAAVARSLQVRGDMNFEEGLHLAAVYEDRIRSFLARHRAVPHLDITYEAITQHPEPWIQKIIDFLDLTPTEADRTRAVALVLSKKKLRTFKIKRRLKKGMKQPWKIPGYVLEKIRHHKQARRDPS